MRGSITTWISGGLYPWISGVPVCAGNAHEYTILNQPKVTSTISSADPCYGPADLAHLYANFHELTQAHTQT